MEEWLADRASDAWDWVFAEQDPSKEERDAQRARGEPVSAPATPPGFPNATTKDVTRKTPNQGGGSLRKRWRDDNGDILEWDRQHGTVEKYNGRGRHKGEFDADTGDELKKANPKRRVEP